MKSPLDVLDRLADCAEVCAEDFPAAIIRDLSAGNSLIITTDSDERFRVTCERIQAEKA